MNRYLQLFRVQQWYKNGVLFLALFFSGNLLQLPLLLTTILSFFSFCFLSSANYIINDLVDRKKDKLHPEKKHRPLAAGEISGPLAVLIALLLLGIGSFLAVNVSVHFVQIAGIFFLLSLFYTFVLKDILFADILTIGTLFVLRAIAGAIAISVKISPWLILCPFFLSLFLSIGKRHAEVHLLKEKASVVRKVLLEYSHDLTTSLMIISTTLLVLSYSLYSFLSEHTNLIYTLPFSLFVIFRFYYFVNSQSEIARNPHLAFCDRQMLLGLGLWLLVTALVLYG